MNKKKYPPDTGNTIQSIYAGFEQPAKKSPTKRSRRSIESIDDIPSGKLKNYKSDSSSNKKLKK